MTARLACVASALLVAACTAGSGAGADADTTSQTIGGSSAAETDIADSGGSSTAGSTDTVTGDGSTADASTSGTGGREVAPAQQIVFMLPTGDPDVPGGVAPMEVAIVNLDGSDLRQLTDDGTQKFLPHFSPDATKVVYTRYSAGGYGAADAEADIAIYDFALEEEILVTDTRDATQATFSPDGTRIAYGRGTLTMPNGDTPGLYLIDLDGTDPQYVGSPSGAEDDFVWGDFAWSSDDWILFVAAENVDGCFKTRLDKIRPDGSSRTKVTDGGPNCTPMGMEQSGDADPGWSADGQTIYSSRGFPMPPTGGPSPGSTERKLYAFSSDPWEDGKIELDLSLPSQPSCIEGVPKGSPDGTRVLLFRMCFDDGEPKPGVYVTDTSGSYRTFVTEGFGPDWNPLARP